MRKLLLTGVLAVIFTGLFAQKTDDIREKIGKGKFDEAIEKIEKVLADPKHRNNSEVWFLKAQAYHLLGKAKKDTALASTALNAMATYMRLEETIPDETKRMLHSFMDGNKIFFDIYSTYYQAGAQSFNAKDYESALYNFEQAIQAFELLSKYSITPVKFDTTSTLYAGVAAETLKNTDKAMLYYQRIADQRIPDTTIRGIYEYVVNYYITKNDPANAKKYLEISSAVFPEYIGWATYELDMVGDDKQKMLAKYEELMTRYPNSYELTMDYAIQLLNYVYANDEKPADYLARQERLQKALDHVMSIQPTGMAHYISARHVYNQIADLEDDIRAVRGNTPADQAKRKDLNAKINQKNEELFRHSLAVYEIYSKEPNLKGTEKAYLRESINNLIYYHQSKKQNDRVSFYQEKLKTLK